MWWRRWQGSDEGLNNARLMRVAGRFARLGRQDPAFTPVPRGPLGSTCDRRATPAPRQGDLSAPCGGFHVQRSRGNRATAERFIRTLKEECIYLQDFETLEEARTAIGAFVERYNNGWRLQRHGYMTPARAREKLSRRAA